MTIAEPDTGGLTDEQLALELRRLDPVRRFLATQPIISDVLVCILVLSPAFSRLPLDFSIPAGTSGWVPSALQLLSALVIAARRFYPLAVATGVVALSLLAAYLSVGTLSPVVGVVCAIYAVSASPRTRYPGRTGAAVLVTAELVLMSVVFILTQTEQISAAASPVNVNFTETTHPAGLLLDVLVFGLGALVMGVTVHNRRARDRAQVAELHAGQARQLQSAETAAAQERHRIANEMHDVVAHNLSVMVALADGARTVAPRNLDAAVAAMADVAETGRNALSEMRQVLGNVTNSDELAPLGGDSDSRNVEELVDRVRATGLIVKYHRTGADLPDNTAVQLAIYRLVQESLTNVLRHAGPGTVVRVELRHDPVERSVAVSVSNAPPPHPPERSNAKNSSKRGLLGLRERVELLGGEFLSGPTMAGGWRMQATIPTEQANRTRTGTP